MFRMNGLVTLLLLHYSILFCCNLQAQTLAGSLHNAHTGEAIVFGHIGILNTQLGTISDEQGTFKISLSSFIGEDQLIQFSAIGYRSRQIPIAEVRKDAMIKLEPASLELPEVTVTDRQRTRITSGGHFGRSRKIVTGWAQSASRGGIRAARIKLPNKAPDALLQSFRFHLAYNEFDSILFRLHIFYPDSTGQLPGEPLPLAEDIFIRHGNTSGEINVNLSSRQILVTQDFFIGLEVVRVYGNCRTSECLHFSVVLFKERIYYRNTLTEKWDSHKLGSPAFDISMKY